MKNSILEESDIVLLSSVKEMISEIREFAYGPSDECSNYDKHCFLLWFCYNFHLYQEGGLIFRKIDKDKVSKELYNMVSLLGSTCEENSVEEKLYKDDTHLEIFGNYKGKEFRAIYYSENKIYYNGKISSASAACESATGQKSCNGWKFWKFKKNGKIYFIDDLRK